ncbi:hypothetical protein ACOMHN_014065 [Nucella lapillus]
MSSRHASSPPRAHVQYLTRLWPQCFALSRSAACSKRRAASPRTSPQTAAAQTPVDVVKTRITRMSGGRRCVVSGAGGPGTMIRQASAPRLLPPAGRAVCISQNVMSCLSILSCQRVWVKQERPGSNCVTASIGPMT